MNIQFALTSYLCIVIKTRKIWKTTTTITKKTMAHILVNMPELYAQDVADYSDDVINDAFDGDPDAYWNID